MTPERAILLLRISYRKPDGEAGETEGTPHLTAVPAKRPLALSKGIGRQEEDGRALAARLGWTITKVIVEDDTSAFKRRKVQLPDGSTGLRTVRPGFREAIDLLTSGTNDGLIADDLDRVARDPRDLEDLIDVVESRTPNIPVTSVTGSLRLDSDAGIAMARVMVTIANKSSRDTARRVARKHLELAAEGKPGGGGFRPYGFTAKDRTLIQAEADVVKEIAARILGDWDGWTTEQHAKIDPNVGETLTSIAKDLNRRSIPTATGVPWSDRSVRSVVSKASVAGLREHRGEVVGKAVWPAILEPARWEQVVARLAGRNRVVDLTLQRWLTGALRCPFCRFMLVGAQGNRGPQSVRYWCATPEGGCGKIAIKASLAEGEVERQILELLAQPDVLASLRTLADTEVTDTARAGLAEDEDQLRQMAGMWARREITFIEYTEARRIVEARVKESRALLVSRAPRVLRTLLAGNVAEGWKGLTPADKREVVLALVPGYDVMPHDPSMGNRFDPGRLVPFPEKPTEGGA
ncbi:recombinase family protein [Streptomyces rhizosphaericola]|uniref:recombinase family protein n=1 Tax=Streptomyces rhizosphaericola TaxID=2564098 RepID=UPI0039F04735